MAGSMNIDIGRSVTYPFEDQQWVTKVGILMVLGLIPGLNVIMWSGYALTVARNVMRGERLPLPDWAEWSDIAVRGLLSIAAAFIYYIPLLLVSCCLGIGLPLITGRDNSALSLVVQCCLGVVSLIYGIAANLLLNVGHVRFVQTDQFNVYMDFARRIEDLRTNTNLFVTLFIYLTLIGIIGAFVAVILAITCVGPFVISTLAFLASGYVMGLAASAARRPQMA
jgi:Protein of unknown function (DUF4013)